MPHQTSGPLAALRALQSRPATRFTRSPLEGDGVSMDVLQSDPSLLLPIVAEQRAGQTGLDILRSQLGPSPRLEPQRIATEDTLERQRQARLGGFESPQAQARYQQEQERIKAEVPVRQAEAAGRAGLEQQREQSRGALDVAREQSAGKANFLDQMLELQRSGAVPPGGSMSISGMGSIRTPQEQRAPASLLRDVLAARNAMETTQRQFFPGLDARQAQNVYNQALGAVYGQDPAAPELKQLATVIALDPVLRDLPSSAVISHPKLQEYVESIDLNPQEMADLDRLLNYSRGIATGIR